MVPNIETKPGKYPPERKDEVPDLPSWFDWLVLAFMLVVVSLVILCRP